MIPISGLTLTHTFKLHGNNPKPFNASSIESRRGEALLKFNFLNECRHISERCPQLPHTRDLGPALRGHSAVVCVKKSFRDPYSSKVE